MGVSAPFRCDGFTAGEELDGEVEGEGVVMLLGGLLPLVAAIEGEAGGSGERVKYTTFARDPPTYETGSG
jgi:hypothetical protein